ncbi:hypothetical protein C0Q70_13465 [Pomacea canaliculata]|uniref:Uncharacterized protein n=1 Tax=Pomacea canaliculata TaxID=400727 RepID=A0A2T7NXB6_POMCA|nr:hypothetical protein C0Q70_13465 [Pomacea canaliculata]
MLLNLLCKECGCACHSCIGVTSNLDLHEQIEALRSQLQRSQASLGQVEMELIEGRQLTAQELAKTRDELARLRERYERLIESHKKMQKLNNNLEDKLLKLVNQFESEKTNLQQELSTMTTRVLDARVYINELEEENDKYRSDCNVAVQLLQCKPSNFVGQRLHVLPIELQERVRKHMTREQQQQSQKSEEERLLRVPMPTFPPTAMVFSLDSRHPGSANLANGNSPGEDKETVPMAIIAKVLTQGPSKRNPQRSYLCVSCHQDIVMADKATQANLLLDHSIVVDRIPTNGVHQASKRADDKGNKGNKSNEGFARRHLNLHLPFKFYDP